MQDQEIEELTRRIQEVEQQNELLREQRPRVGQMPQLDPNDQYQQQYEYQQEVNQQPDMGMDAQMDMGQLDGEESPVKMPAEEQ